MSKLSALQGKSKTVKLGEEGNEIELEIKPLGLDDMNLFAIDESSSAKEKTESSVKLIKKVLKTSVPDATEEELNSGLKYMKELMEVIMEVNGMQEQKKRSPLEIIKERQAQAASAKASGQ